jgi:hypothetical protein
MKNTEMQLQVNDGKERVALDLMREMLNSSGNAFLKEKMSDPKRLILGLYKECLAAVSGSEK